MFLTSSSIKYLNINILKIKPQNFYQFLFQDTIKMTTPIANNELKKEMKLKKSKGQGLILQAYGNKLSINIEKIEIGLNLPLNIKHLWASARL